ncbi:hypothetical protein NVV99_23565 [Rhodococcus sp. PAE-6]|uniref:hypothetical protein n=1 Tax=Rhodococcus sp. PAE-6 TaxID=2972477 RepID=UPI0021B291D4|nr:hypothetical protein [Rhodococcus sp. PAE-6]MCT7293887.1 hypothetical protein [Rhodococcus sp. PAE-6]
MIIAAVNPDDGGVRDPLTGPQLGQPVDRRVRYLFVVDGDMDGGVGCRSTDDRPPGRMWDVAGKDFAEGGHRGVVRFAPDRHALLLGLVQNLQCVLGGDEIPAVLPVLEHHAGDGKDETVDAHRVPLGSADVFTRGHQ